MTTPNHPFWVNDVGWTRADQLNDMSSNSCLKLANGESAYIGWCGPVTHTAKQNIDWARFPSGGGNYSEESGFLLNLTEAGISAEFGYLPGNIVLTGIRGEIYSIYDNRDFDWRKSENDYRCTVYNLEIEDFHSYFVGTYGVWVHNTNCISYYTHSAASSLYSPNRPNGLVLVEQGKKKASANGVKFEQGVEGRQSIKGVSVSEEIDDGLAFSYIFNNPNGKCRIPDDSIQFSRWPLFFAREVLREVIDSQKSRKGEEDGTSSA